MPIQDTVNAQFAGKTYVYSLTYDPSIKACSAFAGTMALGVGSNPLVKGKLWLKQDDGLSLNWTPVPTGALRVRGTWDANTNVPNLNTIAKTQGDFWIVTTAGNTNLGGITSWQVHDWAVYLGAGNWDQVSNNQTVVSVNGQVGIVDLEASNIPNDSLVAGTQVSDALNTLLTGMGGGSKPSLWYDVKPMDGKVLPVAVARAYYTQVLYSAVAAFNDGTNLRKYVAYYGKGSTPSALSFSDDGINWDNEKSIVGVVGEAYHCAVVLIGTIIHFFYWDTTVTIYSPAAIRHATIDASVNAALAISDNALSGNYVTGVFADGLRYGTYGPSNVFYNAAPTNNPANPYSYQWCMIFGGTTGSLEGVLFATSSDGLNFSAWGGANEVIPRNASAWDKNVGALAIFIDSQGLWHCFYSGGLGTGSGGEDSNYAGGIGYATSTDGINWTKYVFNPILRKTDSLKSWKRLYTPCVIYDNTGYWMYFACKSLAGVYVTTRAQVNGWV